jgi:hypothetical protein
VVSFTHRPYPQERASGTHWIGGWVGHRAVLDAVVKRQIPSLRWESNPKTPIIQSVAQRYTDYTKKYAVDIILARVYIFGTKFDEKYNSFHIVVKNSGRVRTCELPLNTVLVYEFDSVQIFHVLYLTGSSEGTRCFRVEKDFFTANLQAMPAVVQVLAGPHPHHLAERLQRKGPASHCMSATRFVVII